MYAITNLFDEKEMAHVSNPYHTNMSAPFSVAQIHFLGLSSLSFLYLIFLYFSVYFLGRDSNVLNK